MVGGVNDPPGWDHMDNAAATVTPVTGTAEVDVNEVKNTGQFEARLKIAEGDLVLAISMSSTRARTAASWRISTSTAPTQVWRHNWPKAFVLSGRVGIRSRDAQRQVAVPGLRSTFHGHPGHSRPETLRVNYPMANKKGAAGEVNPATQQIDFYIRSPQMNPKNRPTREVFMHFFGMEVTWK